MVRFWAPVWACNMETHSFDTGVADKGLTADELHEIIYFWDGEADDALELIFDFLNYIFVLCRDVAPRVGDLFSTSKSYWAVHVHHLRSFSALLANW